MKLIDRVHGGYVETQRARVLSKHLAEIIPDGYKLLDVGCGNGLIACLITELRPDLNFCGLEVLDRDGIYIPIERFNGETIPYDDASFDGVIFVDVLHHTHDPMTLLREATRVARKTVVIKDHLLEGVLAGPTLRLMDWVGNARYGVSLPYNYWTKLEWLEAFQKLGVKVQSWTTSLRLYPWPTSFLFDRSLHFVARLELQHTSSV
jgi:SAM-dependent methyltransferase